MSHRWLECCDKSRHSVHRTTKSAIDQYCTVGKAECRGTTQGARESKIIEVSRHLLRSLAQ